MTAFRKQSPAAVEAAPQCPYCGAASVFLPSTESLYRGQDYGPAFVCKPCGAWVGAHRDTLKPMGRLANKELRALKIQCHARFNPLYLDLRSAYPDHGPLNTYKKKVRHAARSRAYEWLAEQLNIAGEDCHIGMFDEARCKQVIALLDSLKPTSATVRAWWRARHPQSEEVTP